MSDSVDRDPEEVIEAARTDAGGFTREQLEEWGVPWPPPKGWKRELLRSWRGNAAPRKH